MPLLLISSTIIKHETFPQYINQNPEIKFKDLGRLNLKKHSRKTEKTALRQTAYDKPPTTNRLRQTAYDKPPTTNRLRQTAYDNANLLLRFEYVNIMM